MNFHEYIFIWYKNSAYCRLLLFYSKWAGPAGCQSVWLNNENLRKLLARFYFCFCKHNIILLQNLKNCRCMAGFKIYIYIYIWLQISKVPYMRYYSWAVFVYRYSRILLLFYLMIRVLTNWVNWNSLYIII